MNFSELAARSYVPYSGLKQVCIVRGRSGTIYGGVRIENLSYPLSISRFQSALFNCLAAGDSPEAIILPDNPSHNELHEYWTKEYGCEIETDPGTEFTLYNPLISGLNNEADILKKLRELCDSAVTPNSDFQVSALLETSEGLIPGVNVECSSWELGLCAERVAISRAFSSGCTDFGDMYVSAPKSEYVSPCGGCRQVLFEHLPNSRIILDQNDNRRMSVKTTQLLPYHFGGEVLRKSNS